ncbi:uncharacterized protein LOC110855957 [Folsomia candida]|uniref:Copine-D n=1 Tax=Folsomia candida TaxID=158441 RepID=A0A226DNV7_FOLCA|nr:uncharacterized protein LOC110855957 [Folsomia candida]OXA46780.1 Copine-D [Folsomia candida]
MRKMGITAGVVLASCVLVTLATASSSPGTTEIQYFIVNAYNIPNRDLPGDLSDPYLVIKNRTGGTVYRSNYQDNKINATFDPVSFNVLPNEMYHIDILDRDPISDDETCGSVYVLGHSLVGSPHNLSNPSGGGSCFAGNFQPSHQQLQVQRQLQRPYGRQPFKQQRHRNQQPPLERLQPHSPVVSHVPR